jgi:hypothetical protein
MQLDFFAFFPKNFISCDWFWQCDYVGIETYVIDFFGFFPRNFIFCSLLLNNVTMYVEIKTNALGKILVFLLTTLILMVNL